MVLSIETILEKTVMLLQTLLLCLIKMHLDHPASSPLLSDYDDSNLEEGNGNNGLPIDDVSKRTKPSLISKVMEEIKSIYIMAFPVIMSRLLLYGKSAISIHFLGKISIEALAGGCLAIAIANITGYSLICGITIGMQGISLKAYNAQQWVLVGKTLHCTIMILILACIPISILWLSFKYILCMFGQNPTISSIAGTYLAFSLPSLILQSIIEPLKIHMSIHKTRRPLVFILASSVPFHGLINHVMISHYSSLGVQGIALAGALTNLGILIALSIYIRVSGACSESNQGLSFQCLKLWKPIVCKSMPSCLTICLYWGWYEIVMLVLGILTNDVHSIATLGIIIEATSLMCKFPFALSLVISQKIGFQLWANGPNKAKTTSYAAMLCALFTSIMTMVFMVSVRHVWGRFFTEDAAILKMVAATLPIAGVCEMVKSPRTIISGILRRAARAREGGLADRISLVSFYCLGLPVSVLMGFGMGLGLTGFLLGLLVARMVSVFALMIVLARTDWEVQANRV